MIKKVQMFQSVHLKIDLFLTLYIIFLWMYQSLAEDMSYMAQTFLLVSRAYLKLPFALTIMHHIQRVKHNEDQMINLVINENELNDEEDQ